MAQNTAVSVTQAVKLAKREVGMLPTLTVTGEVSGFRGPNARSGHCYFQLKDDDSVLECIIWQNIYDDANIQLKDGLEISITGKFDVYEAQGSLSFKARSFTVAGEGLLRQQVAALARKLQAEGLMDETRKRPPVRFCERIIVCTSLSGSVKDDVLRTLARRNPLVKVGLVGCKVQGADAASTIIEAIKIAESYRPDCILVVRGGGSFEDLMCFNDESLARCIASCTVPVVTGIGHEPDTSISDMVADRRTSTPTAAAESVAPALEEIVATLDLRNQRLVSSMNTMLYDKGAMLDTFEQKSTYAIKHTLDSNKRTLEQIGSRKCLSDPFAVVNMHRENLYQTTQRLLDAMPRCLTSYAKEVKSIEDRFQGMDRRMFLAYKQSIAQNSYALKNIGAHMLDSHTNELASSTTRLNQASLHMLDSYTNELASSTTRLNQASMHMLDSYTNELASSTTRLNQASLHMFDSYEKNLSKSAAMLQALSPLKVLSRGYSIVEDEAGHVVQGIDDVEIGQNVDIRLSQGYISATVNNKRD